MEARIRFIEQRASVLSYAAVGATSDMQKPAGFEVDHNRVLLGSGRNTFEHAKTALEAWKMFDIGWCSIAPSSSPLQKGTIVAIVTKHCGIWSMNAARIVYTIDDHISQNNNSHSTARFGFAYGTLADHSERGEERFAVEWNSADDNVWFDIYAFSRPRHVLARMGYPLARMLQKRFAKNAMKAMTTAMVKSK